VRADQPSFSSFAGSCEACEHFASSFHPGAGVKKEGSQPAQQNNDALLSRFLTLGKGAELPSLPLPSVSAQPSKVAGEDGACTACLDSKAEVDEGSAVSEKQGKTAILPPSTRREDDYIPLEATVPAPSTSTTPNHAASTAATTSTSTAADIEANLGRRPYWMKHCQHIRSPLLRLHQGKS